MSKPRVLMIGPDRGVMGGIPTVVNNYYAAGLDKDVELRYLSTMEDGSKIKKLIVAVKAYAKLGKQMKNCDIVHIHMSENASFDRKALFVKKAHKAGKKIIIHEHGAEFKEYFYDQIDEKKRRYIKDIFAMADKVIALSEEWADFFGKNVCDPEKIEVFHNGVLLPEYIKEDYSSSGVLMLGRLGQRKGTYDLLKAAPEVVKAVPDAVFYLGGDGEVEQCKKIVADSGMDQHVKFLGWVRDSDRDKYLEQCSVFILPSYNEGMPMSVLEAMSYGLATVSTDVGGIPQVIDQNVCGIMVKPGDVRAITATLIDLLTDEEKKSRLGKAGRDRIADSFNLSKQTDRLIKLYHELSQQ